MDYILTAFKLLLCQSLMHYDVVTSRDFETDEGSRLIICQGGQFTAPCPSGQTINVTFASYGRNSKELICLKDGFENTKFCQSPHALKRIQEHCRARNTCTMEVNAETLGRPVTESRESCVGTSLYLEIVYSCLTDCPEPVFGYNTQIIGQNYHVGSVVTVQCRSGYEQIDGTGGVEKTCKEIVGWVGKTLLCRDIDECETPSKNRCHRYASCHNTRGSYSCRCAQGYHGDGYVCTSESWFKDDDWSDVGTNSSGIDDEDSDDSWDEALIEVHNEKICGKRIHKSRQGVLTSPNYPELYPGQSSCIWIINVPRGLVVQIRFMKFDLETEQKNEGCSRDNITLYDGLNKDPKWWLGTYCGDEAPPPITSQTNKLRIEFKTDESAEFKGFEARYFAIDLNSACLNFPAVAYDGIIVMNASRNATTQPRNSIELGCQAGYTVISQMLVRTCQDDGTWDDYENPCEPVSCGAPYLPIDDDGLIVKDEVSRFRYKQLPVRYECKVGYRIHIEQGTDALIYCDHKGRWSNRARKNVPWCEKITCVCESEFSCAPNEGDPTQHKELKWEVRDPEGKLIEDPVGQSLSYGTQIIYSCEKGFSLSGDEVRLCADDGWSGRRTTCEQENGIGNLSNFHIAIIASGASGFVILIIAIALIICCVRDHKRKAKKRKQLRQRRMRAAARDNEGFSLNFAVAGSDDFLYTLNRNNYGKNRSNGFAGRHNDISKYQPAPERHQVLPTAGVIAPPAGYYHDEYRSRTNQTFRPQYNNHNNTDAPTAKKLGNGPPPGYQDPPPSYDTMVREGYSERSNSYQYKNKKRSKR